MSDGILQTHGKMLAAIGGLLVLVVVLVGERGSPGVLSEVQAQADAANGQLKKPNWFGPDPAPPTGAMQPGRSDGVGDNTVKFGPGGLPLPEPDQPATAQNKAPDGPPVSAVGRPST